MLEPMEDKCRLHSIASANERGRSIGIAPLAQDQRGLFYPYIRPCLLSTGTK